MDETSSSRLSSNIVRLVGISIGHFLNDFYMNLVPPILFIFAGALSLTLIQQGFLAFVITSSGSFFQPIIGYLVDKRGKPHLLVYSLIWIAFWMSITGIINNYYILAIALCLGALASALYHPLGSSVTIKLIRKAQGTSLSFFMTIGSFAGSVSPLVALPLVNNYGLRSLIYLLIPGIMGAFFMHLTKLSNIELQAYAIQEDKKNVERKANTYMIKWLSILVAISTVRYWISRSLLVFGVQYLLLKEVSITMAALVISLYLFSLTLGIFIGGIITDIIGTKNMLIISYLLSIICVGLMFITTGISTAIAFLLLGFVISTSSTANIVIAHDLAPENITLATGMIMGFAGGLGGLGILLYGIVADVVGLLNATLFLLIPLILSTIFIIILPQTLSNKKLLKNKLERVKA